MRDKSSKEKVGNDREAVSLSPLRLKEALAGLLAVKPPQDESPGKRKKKRDLEPKNNDNN